jgi:hypothetical protein
MIPELTKLIEELEQINQENFESYVNMDQNTSDYFVKVGISDGLIKAIDKAKELNQQN